MSEGNDCPGTLSHVAMNSNAGEKKPPNASLITVPTSSRSVSLSEKRKKMLPNVRRSKSFQKGAMRMSPDDKGNGLDEKLLKGARRDSIPLTLTYSENDISFSVTYFVYVANNHYGVCIIGQKKLIHCSIMGTYIKSVFWLPKERAINIQLDLC